MQRSVTPRRLAVLTIVLLVGSLAAADSPPPIPSAEVRARLVEAEREAAMASRWEMAPRAIHDEYDVAHYDVALDIDIPAHIVTGTVEVTATASVADLSEIRIDLFDCMTVDAVTAGGSSTAYVHDNDILTVTLDDTYQPGEQFTIAGSFHGAPAFPGNPPPFRWASQNGVPMVLTYSEPYGAPAWWLCKDDPKDKATYAVHITVPDSLFAVTNGALQSTVDNGDGTLTFNWTTAYPMSVYLFSLAITKYAHWTEVYTGLDGMTTMNVDYYAYPADSADARVDWSRNIEMMEYYAGLFGEYPFMDEKYAIAEFHHGGAMEHQTATSMGYPWITGDNSNDFVVAHELAHSWVGDMITMTEWSHAWCKEGFATYCEALYFEDRYGVDYYHQYMDEMNVMHYAMDRLYNINPPLDGAIYYKGAWVLHMLRHVLGDTDFFASVYAYTNHPDFRYGVADTDDLCAVFSDVAGTDLTWFFYQWIYSWGYPVYGMHWWAEDARSGYDITLRIDQTQTVGPVFKMPIDILIQTDLGEERFVVWDTLETQTFSFHVEGEPLDLVLDPDDWIICEIEFVGDVRGGDQLRVWLPQNHPNPFGAETWIGFHLESAGPARLDIYDLNGRWVTRLLDGPQVAGPARVRWNGRDARGRRVPPGVYYCHLRAGTEATTRRILCVR